MRKLMVLTVPLLLAAGTLAAVGDGPGFLARFERFHASAVEVRGNRYVGTDEISQWIPAYQEERGGARALERRLRTHILVEEATVRVLPDDAVEIVIKERQPVGFVATPALDPVDRNGQYLPIDPALHRLDLPILRPAEPRSDALTLPEHQQIQTLADELHRLGELNPDFARSVSELVWISPEMLIARLSGVWAEVRFEPPVGARRLRQGLAALADALARAPQGVLTVADLRFQGQVVVSHAPLNRSSSGRR